MLHYIFKNLALKTKEFFPGLQCMLFSDGIRQLYLQAA